MEDNVTTETKYNISILENEKINQMCEKGKQGTGAVA